MAGIFFAIDTLFRKIFNLSNFNFSIVSGTSSRQNHSINLLLFSYLAELPLVLPSAGVVAEGFATKPAIEGTNILVNGLDVNFQVVAAGKCIFTL